MNLYGGLTARAQAQAPRVLASDSVTRDCRELVRAIAEQARRNPMLAELMRCVNEGPPGG
jgi:hypothetical protein